MLRKEYAIECWQCHCQLSMHWKCYSIVVRCFYIVFSSYGKETFVSLYICTFFQVFKLFSSFLIQFTFCDAHMRRCFYRIQNLVYVIIHPFHLFVLIECIRHDQKVNDSIKTMIVDMVKWIFMLNAQDSRNELWWLMMMISWRKQKWTETQKNACV